jgi:hypothetical protein
VSVAESQLSLEEAIYNVSIIDCGINRGGLVNCRWICAAIGVGSPLLDNQKLAGAIIATARNRGVGSRGLPQCNTGQDGDCGDEGDLQLIHVHLSSAYGTGLEIAVHWGRVEPRFSRATRSFQSPCCSSP